MSLVLDSCVFFDLAVLKERDTRHVFLDRRTEQDICYMTPIEVAEVDYRLRKDVDSTLADMMIATIKRGPLVRIVETIDLIELASQARSRGVPPHIAFTGALARRLDAPVLVAANQGNRVEQYQRLEGFCRVEVY